MKKEYIQIPLTENRINAQKEILSDLRCGMRLPNYFMGCRIYHLSTDGSPESEELWTRIFFNGVFWNNDYNWLLSEYCYLNPLT